MPNLPRWLILCGWVEAELATWTDAAKNTCLYFGSLQRAGQVGVDSFFQPALKLTWWSPPWTDFLGVGIGPSWLTSSTRRNGCQTWYQHGLKQNGTNYPTRMLCSKCFVTRGVYRHILFKSTLCGGSIWENLWTLPDRNAQQNTPQGKRGIFYSQNNFCPTNFCFTAEVRALMELIIWSNNTVT